MKRLSQVLAVEKQVKNKTNDRGSELLKQLMKQELFNGFNKTFQPLEDGENVEPENKTVAANANKILNEFLKIQGELLDVTLTKDVANSATKGTLKFGSFTRELPVTFILWLEKQVLDIKKVVDELPTLSMDKQWSYDSTRELHVTEPVKTARNKKKKVPLVLYEATEKHPAQVQVHEEDVLQGHWSSVITSSAVKPSDKEKYQLRVEMLLKALKEAREDANASYVEEQNFSADLVSYLFG